MSVFQTFNLFVTAPYIETYLFSDIAVVTTAPLGATSAPALAEELPSPLAFLGVVGGDTLRFPSGSRRRGPVLPILSGSCPRPRDPEPRFCANNRDHVLHTFRGD